VGLPASYRYYLLYNMENGSRAHFKGGGLERHLGPTGG
jgi:hypothetical protein